MSQNIKCVSSALLQWYNIENAFLYKIILYCVQNCQCTGQYCSVISRGFSNFTLNGSCTDAFNFLNILASISMPRPPPNSSFHLLPSSSLPLLPAIFTNEQSDQRRGGGLSISVQSEDISGWCHINVHLTNGLADGRGPYHHVVSSGYRFVWSARL